MGKVLLWALVILGGLILARVLARAHEKSQRDDTPIKQSRPRVAPAEKETETMVRCANCGIHLPRSDALLSNGHTWCSQEHAKLGVRK